MNWKSFKDISLRFFGGLFMERKGNVWAISVGRVSWWLAFCPALYIWVELAKDISPNHLTILLILATYNFGKKVVDKIRPPLVENGGVKESV